MRAAPSALDKIGSILPPVDQLQTYAAARTAPADSEACSYLAQPSRSQCQCRVSASRCRAPRGCRREIQTTSHGERWGSSKRCVVARTSVDGYASTDAWKRATEAERKEAEESMYPVSCVRLDTYAACACALLQFSRKSKTFRSLLDPAKRGLDAFQLVRRRVVAQTTTQR